MAKPHHALHKEAWSAQLYFEVNYDQMPVILSLDRCGARSPLRHRPPTWEDDLCQIRTETQRRGRRRSNGMRYQRDKPPTTRANLSLRGNPMHVFLQRRQPNQTLGTDLSNECSSNEANRLSGGARKLQRLISRKRNTLSSGDSKKNHKRVQAVVWTSRVCVQTNCLDCPFHRSLRKTLLAARPAAHIYDTLHETCTRNKKVQNVRQQVLNLARLDPKKTRHVCLTQTRPTNGTFSAARTSLELPQG